MGKYKDLEALLYKIYTRPALVTTYAKSLPKVQLNFDADRFRWLFKRPYLDVLYFVERQVHPSLQEWRDLIDEAMKNANAEHPETDKANNKSP